MFAFVFFSPRQKFPSGWNGPNNNTKIWLFLVVRAEDIHHQQLIQTELLRCIHYFQEIRSVLCQIQEGMIGKDIWYLVEFWFAGKLCVEVWMDIIYNKAWLWVLHRKEEKVWVRGVPLYVCFDYLYANGERGEGGGGLYLWMKKHVSLILRQFLCFNDIMILLLNTNAQCVLCEEIGEELYNWWWCYTTLHSAENVFQHKQYKWQ